MTPEELMEGAADWHQIAAAVRRAAALERENALLKDDNERKRLLLVARADEGMGQAFLARMDTLERENARLHAVLAELVAAHDAPPWGGGDDPDYEKALAAGRRMDAAWDRAREALDA